MMNLQWYDFVGFAGVFLVLVAYFLLQTSRMRGDRVPYSLINAVGAGGILVSVWYAPNLNWPVLFIEAAWVLISLYGIWHSLRRGPRKASPDGP